MSLISEVANLMHDSVTVYRFLNVSQQGADSFGGTEDVSPVRISRHLSTVYDDKGRAVTTRAKIIMPVPSSGPLNRLDKLVSGDGEIFRVFHAGRKKDKDGSEYQVVIAT